MAHNEHNLRGIVAGAKDHLGQRTPLNHKAKK